MTYADHIRTTLATTGHAGKYDPRHIEAYMRLEHPTLDALSPAQFTAEVEMGRQCVDAAPAEAERLARSYGL